MKNVVYGTHAQVSSGNLRGLRVLMSPEDEVKRSESSPIFHTLLVSSLHFLLFFSSFLPFVFFRVFPSLALFSVFFLSSLLSFRFSVARQALMKIALGRVRKRHPTMFYRCLPHGALIREKDRIPFGWCFRPQPCKFDLRTWCK